MPPCNHPVAREATEEKTTETRLASERAATENTAVEAKAAGELPAPITITGFKPKLFLETLLVVLSHVFDFRNGKSTRVSILSHDVPRI